VLRLSAGSQEAMRAELHSAYAQLRAASAERNAARAEARAVTATLSSPLLCCGWCSRRSSKYCHRPCAAQSWGQAWCRPQRVRPGADAAVAVCAGGPVVLLRARAQAQRVPPGALLRCFSRTIRVVRASACTVTAFCGSEFVTRVSGMVLHRLGVLYVAVVLEECAQRLLTCVPCTNALHSTRKKLGFGRCARRMIWTPAAASCARWRPRWSRWNSRRAWRSAAPTRCSASP